MPLACCLRQGTLSHMSPELLLDGRASRASDVYAMGVLMWEALTGARPWAGLPAAALPTTVVLQRGRPAWLPGWQGALPGPLVALVEQAWAHEPSAR
jgi:serine/threonine protein kinase